MNDLDYGCFSLSVHLKKTYTEILLTEYRTPRRVFMKLSRCMI